MSADGTLVWSTPGATFALIVQDGVVIAAPPYAARWAYGKTARSIWNAGKAKGVDLTWLPRPDLRSNLSRRG